MTEAQTKSLNLLKDRIIRTSTFVTVGLNIPTAFGGGVLAFFGYAHAKHTYMWMNESLINLELVIDTLAERLAMWNLTLQPREQRDLFIFFPDEPGQSKTEIKTILAHEMKNILMLRTAMDDLYATVCLEQGEDDDLTGWGIHEATKGAELLQEQYKHWQVSWETDR